MSFLDARDALFNQSAVDCSLSAERGMSKPVGLGYSSQAIPILAD